MTDPLLTIDDATREFKVRPMPSQSVEAAPVEARTAYGVELIAANAVRLVEPSIPDLVHVGQTILLAAGT